MYLLVSCAMYWRWSAMMYAGLGNSFPPREAAGGEKPRPSYLEPLDFGTCKTLGGKKGIWDFSDSFYCARDGDTIQEWAFGWGPWRFKLLTQAVSPCAAGSIGITWYPLGRMFRQWFSPSHWASREGWRGLDSDEGGHCQRSLPLWRVWPAPITQQLAESCSRTAGSSGRV